MFYENWVIYSSEIEGIRAMHIKMDKYYSIYFSEKNVWRTHEVQCHIWKWNTLDIALYFSG